jgi:RNA polymerase sigma factor (sigma-70 family)
MEIGRRSSRASERGSGDAALFSELYRQHALTVYGWFRRRGCRSAADLTAETFAQAWLSRRRFRNEHDQAAVAWLLGIALNVLRESARRDRVETRARERLGLPLAVGEDESYAAVDERLSVDPDLLAAVANLPAHERDAVALRVVDELSYEDVARALRIRPAAARLRVSRALRRLQSSNPEEGL